VKFQLEKIAKVKVELEPLLYAHWREIAHYQDIVLNPDWDHYIAGDENGLLRCFTARDEEEDLVGYAIFWVRPNAHYKDSLQAAQDVLFIHPTRRGFGAKFILWCDDQLAAEGVQAVYHHVKAAHDFGSMLERFGYEVVDLIYARRLD